jgi:hypothetical protein
MIDYSIWDMREEFPLEIAACLWLDNEPGEYAYSSDTDPKYMAIKSVLLEAINNNQLPCKLKRVRQEEHKSNFHKQLDAFVGSMGSEEPVYCDFLFIARDELKKWAEKKGNKPKFLFPEMRVFQESNPIISDTTLSTDTVINNKPGRRSQQVAKINETAIALGYDPLNIPESGKVAIRSECLKDAGIFTDSAFEKAWIVANKKGLIRIKDKEKYI